MPALRPACSDRWSPGSRGWQAGVGIDEGLNDLDVDFVADVALALEIDHVLAAGALGDCNGESVDVGVRVFVRNVTRCRKVTIPPATDSHMKSQIKRSLVDFSPAFD